MLEKLGPTQRRLMNLLLGRKAGLDITVLGEKLGISRTAVRQHLAALERLEWVGRAAATPTGGRPGQTFALTARGHGVFTKQYGMLSGLLLGALLEEKGDAELRRWLGKLGGTVAAGFSRRVAGKPLKVRIVEAAAVMNDLAYEAQVAESGGAIEARNCVYHDLAREHRQVCRFDLALLEGLTGAEVVHSACIQDGADVCRFAFRPKKKG